MRVIIEQSLEWQTPLYSVFVDFQKALWQCGQRSDLETYAALRLSPQVHCHHSAAVRGRHLPSHTVPMRLRFHGFSSGIPCTKPLLSLQTEEKTSTVCTEVFQVDGGGLEASHLLWWIEIRHGLWQQGTSCLAAKVRKAQGGLSEAALSSIRPPLWSGDACHPEELEVCASCLPRRQSTRRCTSIC